MRTLCKKWQGAINQVGRNKITNANKVVPGAVSWEALAALRFVLAAIVVCGHLEWFSEQRIEWNTFFVLLNAKTAVVGFFVVSGYSIAASIEHKPLGFIQRRLLRLYPLYFAALVFTVLVESWTGPIKTPGLQLPTTPWWTVLGNFFFLQTIAVKPIAFDGPVWSLAIEFWYYMLAPLLLRLSPRVIIFIAGCSLVCYFLKTREDLGLIYYTISKLSLLKYLWCWLLGFALWRYRGNAMTVIAVLSIPIIVFGRNTQSPLAWLTYCVTLAIILYAHRLHLSAPFKSFANYLGDLSYPLYLVHLPFFILLYNAYGVNRVELLLLGSLLFTMIFFLVIEQQFKAKVLVPWLGRRRNRSSQVHTN